MSKTGEKNLKLISSVKAEVTAGKIKVTGPKGELTLGFPEDLKVTAADGVISISLVSQRRETLGLYNALISNLVTGVTTGFKKGLEMVGIGYKAKKEGRDLILIIGFSHPVRYSPPQGIEIEVLDDTKIIVSGISRELVGEVAAKIRELKKPEPYKGKGIKYVSEYVKRKAGKAGKVGTAK